VAGAIIEDSDGALLLVCNRRRDGSCDWSTPGGVIEDGEDIVAGLTREVAEETGLVVEAWDGPVYTVEITAPDLGWVLRVEAHRALAWSGDIVLDDPDGIVIDAAFVHRDRCADQLGGGSRWVSEPLLEWVAGSIGHHVGYLAAGSDRASLIVTRQ
jgi:8-oxo-dGTP diphosphatase